jgi:hypothetical protein
VSTYSPRYHSKDEEKCWCILPQSLTEVTDKGWEMLGNLLETNVFTRQPKLDRKLSKNIGMITETVTWKRRKINCR